MGEDGSYMIVGLGPEVAPKRPINIRPQLKIGEFVAYDEGRKIILHDEDGSRITFHQVPKRVYGRIIPPEEYVKGILSYAQERVRTKGVYVCVEFSDGRYDIMPQSYLDSIDPQQEINAIRRRRKNKRSQDDIAFLEKDIKSQTENPTNQ